MASSDDEIKSSEPSTSGQDSKEQRSIYYSAQEDAVMTRAIAKFLIRHELKPESLSTLDKPTIARLAAYIREYQSYV